MTSGLLAGFGPTASLGVAGLLATTALLLAALGAAVVSPVLLSVAVSLVTVAFGIGQPALSAAVGEAVDLDVRGVALGIATLVFMTGGSVGSAVVGGLGDVVGIAASLALLVAAPGGRPGGAAARAAPGARTRLNPSRPPLPLPA